VASPLPVYLDVSLRDFDTVYPAAGSRNSSVRVNPARLAELFDDRWTDVCVLPGG
jgi:prolyl-tRNA editing enzyme YbaK/EbsC (Cys-tRNA(Pro) deacylase)